MCPGHERWHPNPGFYYLAGGGPMLDMGPYHVTDLVNLLGPVASVSGVATSLAGSGRSPASRSPGRASRRGGDPRDRSADVRQRRGDSMTMSFDVPRHRHIPIELYGETGSLIVPDPNYFGGKVELAAAGEDWREIPTRHAYADGNSVSSASPTWRARSGPGGRIGRAARSRFMFSR